jgi:hypothetical protein
MEDGAKAFVSIIVLIILGVVASNCFDSYNEAQVLKECVKTQTAEQCSLIFAPSWVKNNKLSKQGDTK